MAIPKIQLQAVSLFISRLSKRERAIFYVVVFIISLALFDRLIMYPIYSRLISLDKQIRDKETTIKNGLRIIAQKDRIQMERAKYGTFLSSDMSEDEEIRSILKEIENIANKSSIYIVDMKPAGLKTVDTTKKYMISLNCEAQMEQLSEFMFNLEGSNKLLTIEKYQISPKSRESSIAKCSMTIARVVIP